MSDYETHVWEFWKDPVSCLIGCCCPCVLYGMTAERVHGGEMVEHCLWHFGSACVCMCGVKSGPTRQAIRKQYNLDNEILGGMKNPLFPDQAWGEDCALESIPYLGTCALCQDYREINRRNPTSPIDPRPASAFVDDLKTIGGKKAPAPATQAPPSQEMGKGGDGAKPQAGDAAKPQEGGQPSKTDSPAAPPVVEAPPAP